VARSFYVVGEITAQIALPFLRDTARITDVVISSPGGDIGLTYGMFDVAHSRKMNAHIVGLAQSAAAVLLQGGKWRTMTNNSLLMFHWPEEAATPHLRLVEQLVEMVAKRAGMSIPEGRSLFDNTFIKPDRALELGLIDEIRQHAS
jgi:ATP-dependent protease ClpP protease subunit